MCRICGPGVNGHSPEGAGSHTERAFESIDHRHDSLRSARSGRVWVDFGLLREVEAEVGAEAEVEVDAVSCLRDAGRGTRGGEAESVQRLARGR
jgi:hypothetical protein